MTLPFDQNNWDELCEQAPQTLPTGLKHQLSEDELKLAEGVPAQVGRGCCWGMSLSPGILLGFGDFVYRQDFSVKVPVHDHPIQLIVALSGFIECDGVLPTLGGTRGYFSGSGISPGYVEQHYNKERLTFVNVEIEPDWLSAFLQAEQFDGADIRHLLFKGDDWKAAVYPTVTPAMRSLAYQLWNPPSQGIAKRLYLQSKVLELLALHLDLVSGKTAQSVEALGLKPETIESLHHAKEIFTREFEHPPMLLALAKTVGVSDRTLRRGFKSLFGTTITAYVMQQRMQQAHRLLRERKWTVTQVARMVGYSQLGHFSAAFKRQFGITPRECLSGRTLP